MCEDPAEMIRLLMAGTPLRRALHPAFGRHIRAGRVTMHRR